MRLDAVGSWAVAGPTSGSGGHLELRQKGHSVLGAQRHARNGFPYSLSWKVTSWLFCVFLRPHLAIPPLKMISW